jgi:hypothetical protein
MGHANVEVIGKVKSERKARRGRAKSESGDAKREKEQNDHSINQKHGIRHRQTEIE